jgi:hypothetical protein
MQEAEYRHSDRYNCILEFLDDFRGGGGWAPQIDPVRVDGGFGERVIGIGLSERPIPSHGRYLVTGSRIQYDHLQSVDF